MGIPAGLIVWKYVLRNALTSTVTQIGLLFGILLAGAVVIETVFQWPGIGAYAFEAILHSDYAARHGLHCLCRRDLHAGNLLVDIAHATARSAGRRDMSGLRVICCAASPVTAPRRSAPDHRAAGDAGCDPGPLIATHPEAVWDMNPASACSRRAETLLARHRPHGRGHLQPRPLRRPHHAAHRLRRRRCLAADRRADRLWSRAGTNWIGEALMRVSDMFLAVPQIVLAIAIAQTLGPSIENVILALSVTYWPWFARLVYAEVRAIRTRPSSRRRSRSACRLAHRAAARAAERGVADHRAHLDRHGLHDPHCSRARISRSRRAAAGAGVGAHDLEVAGIPARGLVVCVGAGPRHLLVVMGFNLLGDGLRDVLDPRIRRGAPMTANGSSRCATSHRLCHRQRARAGAGRRQPLGRARRDHGPRRRVRLRQDHARPRHARHSRAQRDDRGAGAIRFDGQDLLGMPRERIQARCSGRRITFMPQDPYGAFNPLFRSAPDHGADEMEVAAAGQGASAGLARF